MKGMARRAAGILGDARLTTGLTVTWVLFYMTWAVWGEEAFAGFVSLLGRQPAFQALYLLLLVNLFLRVLSWLRGSKRGLFRTGAGVVLRLGLLLLLSGFFVSVMTKQAMRPLVGEGDVLGARWSEATFPVERIQPSLQERILDVGEGVGLFALEPAMVLKTPDGPASVGAFPPARFGRTWIHILQCGLAPGMRLSRDGRIIREGYAALRLLPPGRTDEFSLERTPYRILFKLIPQRTFRKGKLEVGEYDLTRPLFDVRVLRAKREVARGTSAVPILFDGLTLETLPPTSWALLDVVRDDGIPFVAGGLILIALGAVFAVLRGGWTLVRALFG